MWNVHERTQAEPLTSVHYPAHEQKVFLTESTLSAAAIGDTVAQIDVGEVSYQSTEVVLQRMADQARAVGANVVMNVRIWRGGSGFSWVAPQSSGTAVRLTDTNAIAQLNGYWY
jgi:uncharacterized protein YbjQ (UPF0145 family)